MTTETMTMEQAKQYQEVDLYRWKGCLKPDVYRLLIEAVRQQGKVENPYDVLRGDGLREIVTQYQYKTSQEDLAYKPQTVSFLVMCLGYWGRGKTIREAALKCKEEGGKTGDKAIAYMFIGDDTPEVSRDGMLISEAWSESRMIFRNAPLGVLCRLED